MMQPSPNGARPSEFAQQIAELAYGDHVCLLYSECDEQFAAAVPFLQRGLARGDCCIYVASEQTVEQVASGLADRGVDVAGAVSTGGLRLVTEREAYRRGGSFDPEAMVAFLGQSLAAALAAGFAGFRVIGEMSWALADRRDTARLLEYESLVNRSFANRRVVAICQYNRRLFEPRVVQDVLRSHPIVVVGRQVCENLYYEPPELTIGDDHHAGRVAWMIEQLQGQEYEARERQRIEDSLRQSEQRFARFMRHLPGLAWIKDAEGRYVFANDAAVAAFQVARDALYGKTDDEVFPPETAAQFRANDRRALETEGGIQVVETLEHADGIVHHSLVNKFPIPGGPGEQVLTGGIAIDITEQQRLQREASNSERVYRAIGESIDYGVWVCDPEGRNVYASESFLRLVGLTQQECSNFGWGSVLHPEDAERTIAAWKECVRTRGVWDIEHRFRGVDGNYHPVLARGVPVRDDDGRIICWAGINLDISRIKQAEHALRDVDRRKDEFLAMLAHELRNPLAPLRSGLDLLTLGDGSPEVIELMERQMEQLVRLVDDLLDVSRIMRGRIELRRVPVELAQVIARAFETARPLIDAQRHQLTQSLPPRPVWLDADPVRLAQAVANLLNNAAKYTDPGGQIWLSAEVREGDVCISVRDSGIGIDSGLLPHVFELFTQAERTIDRSQGGLGIGLTVVRSLVEMHGGTVSASSAGRGQGAEFVVRLPTLSRAERTALVGECGASADQLRRVLIVDDNVAAARLLGLLLTKVGRHEVRLAHDGPAAIAVAGDFAPDIVLLDIGLPKVDGYEVARRLRGLPETSDSLLIALTGYGSEEDRCRALAAGFDEHLVKPPSMEALQAAFQLRRAPAPS